jgi:hypothetical protein
VVSFTPAERAPGTHYTGVCNGTNQLYGADSF